MKDDAAAAAGIDLFDFLLELWRSKWLFLGVGALCVAIGIASYLPSMLAPAAPVRLVAQYPFTVVARDYPVRRSSSEIVDEYMELLRASVSDVEFVASVDDRSFSGTITASAQGMDQAFFVSLYDKLESVGANQVVVARADADRYIAKLDGIVAGSSSSDPSLFGLIPYELVRFLADPRVESGELKFIRFKPLDPSLMQIENPRRIGLKRLVLFALIGCIAGTFAVMFRIALERKRKPSSA